MAIVLPSGFTITNNEPADSRITVANSTARLAFSSANVYEGLIVYQQDNDTIYVLTNASSPSVDASWSPIIGSSTAVTNQIVTGSVSASVYLNSNIFLIRSASLTLFSIDSTGSVKTSGSLTLETSGSYNNLFSVRNNQTQSVSINGEGVLVLYQYTNAPTAVSGGLYMDTGGTLYVGV